MVGLFWLFHSKPFQVARTINDPDNTDLAVFDKIKRQPALNNQCSGSLPDLGSFRTQQGMLLQSGNPQFNSINNPVR